jgi:hypothetical protein
LGENLFNLGFGDWNPQTKSIDDSNRTNNMDRDKVLLTVAFSALDFTSQFPKALIYLEGSTPARTRLYQSSIGQHILEINRHFYIRGLCLQRWEPFARGINYDAFLAQRK